MDFGKYLAGLSAKENPHGVHLESMGEGKVLTVDAEVVTIERLHCFMGHISPDTVKVLLKKGKVDGFTLDESSEIKSCNLCKYCTISNSSARGVIWDRVDKFQELASGCVT